MEIKGVGIGRGVAVGSIIRMAAPLPEPSDAPRADTVPAQKEIDPYRMLPELAGS